MTAPESVLQVQLSRPTTTCVLIQVRGELDAAGVGHLHERLASRLSSTAETLVLDVSQLSFIGVPSMASTYRAECATDSATVACTTSTAENGANVGDDNCNRSAATYQDNAAAITHLTITNSASPPSPALLSTRHARPPSPAFDRAPSWLWPPLPRSFTHELGTRLLNTTSQRSTRNASPYAVRAKPFHSACRPP